MYFLLKNIEYDEINYYTDNVFSGLNFARPSFQKMLIVVIGIFYCIVDSYFLILYIKIWRGGFVENTNNIANSTNEKQYKIYCAFNNEGETFQEIMERIIVNKLKLEMKS